MMFRNIPFLTIYILVILFSCKSGKDGEEQSEKTDKSNSVTLNALERYRPVFHFTPAENWINDPNGLVYYNGEYHLFYQYNPYGNTWGHMSWGHAISSDLITWEQLPVALVEEGGIMIFSGSAVVDRGNTSGLCDNDSDCLVAIYTSHIEGEVQHQSIAYSNDQGRSWTKYDKNPVLNIGKRDFRDPKVFWYGPGNKWVMIVSVPLEYKVQFYESDNLIDWRMTGEFGNQGDVSKIWECPDLVHVPIEDTDGGKWVLIISSGSQYGDFTGMQYFTGSFNGEKFIADDEYTKPRWLDYGKDFYAAITYNNLPPEIPPILVGWVNNWRYANSIPTSPWRGMMSVPRELALRKIKGELHLIQQPVSTFFQYLDSTEKLEFENHLIEKNDQLLSNVRSESYRLKIKFENIDSDEFGIELMKGGDERTTVGYNVGKAELFINRLESGNIAFHEFFPSTESAPLEIDENLLSLDILVDRSVVEVFANNGYRVITDQVFPEHEEGGMQLYSKNGKARVVSLEFYKMK